MNYKLSSILKIQTQLLLLLLLNHIPDTYDQYWKMGSREKKKKKAPEWVDAQAQEKEQIENDNLKEEEKS